MATRGREPPRDGELRYILNHVFPSVGTGTIIHKVGFTSVLPRDLIAELTKKFLKSLLRGSLTQHEQRSTEDARDSPIDGDVGVPHSGHCVSDRIILRHKYLVLRIVPHLNRTLIKKNDRSTLLFKFGHLQSVGTAIVVKLLISSISKRQSILVVSSS